MTSAWVYRPPLEAVIGALKFRRLDYLGPRLGRLAATVMRDVLPPVTAVTAVPLHPWRRLTRGYDQAELIARGVAGALGLSFVPVLRRRRATVPQSRLARAARLRNPHGAFGVRGHLPRRGRYHAEIERHRWLLVDDVCTSGATLEAAAACLAAAGAGAVHGFTCARVPDEADPAVADDENCAGGVLRTHE